MKFIGWPFEMNGLEMKSQRNVRTEETDDGWKRMRMIKQQMCGADKAAKEMAKLIKAGSRCEHPPSIHGLGRSAIGLFLQTVNEWNSKWSTQNALCHSFINLFAYEFHILPGFFHLVNTHPIHSKNNHFLPWSLSLMRTSKKKSNHEHWWMMTIGGRVLSHLFSPPFTRLRFWIYFKLTEKASESARQFVTHQSTMDWWKNCWQVTLPNWLKWVNMCLHKKLRFLKKKRIEKMRVQKKNDPDLKKEKIVFHFKIEAKNVWFWLAGWMDR